MRKYKGKPIEVTQETSTGRNTFFRNKSTGKNMSRPDFVNAINKGQYPEYHIRKIHGVNTPASNPDKSEDNNLG